MSTCFFIRLSSFCLSYCQYVNTTVFMLVCLVILLFEILPFCMFYSLHNRLIVCLPVCIFIMLLTVCLSLGLSVF